MSAEQKAPEDVIAAWAAPHVVMSCLLILYEERRVPGRHTHGRAWKTSSNSLAPLRHVGTRNSGRDYADVVAHPSLRSISG
jgi:hypothetical protein